MRRSFKYRIYPTRGQAQRAEACFSDHCRLYNAALEERRGLWEWNQKSISFYGQSAQLKYVRTDDPDQSRWSARSQEATLKRLDRAFQAFFRRVRAGQTPGYPRFKPVQRWDSVTWPSDGDGCKWKPDYSQVYFKGIGVLKVMMHRPQLGVVKTLTLKREGRQWFVVLSFDDVPARPLPVTGEDVGVDVGVARFVTLSDGQIVENPRFTRNAAVELAEAQQTVARRVKGSQNQKRARRKVAGIHHKTRRRRLDFHHKTALKLVEDYDVIVLEDLKITNMIKRAKPKPDPKAPGQYLPNGGAAKTGLNRSISDAAWGQFTSILEAKAESAGRRVMFVNPAYTSITCHICGLKGERPQQDTVICPVHGPLDADLNGALNILSRAGLGSVLTQA